MLAMTFSRQGGPEVLEATELPAPQPGPGQVVIDVAAAGVNRSDVMERGGGFYPQRPQTLVGLECSGTISSLGEGVTGLAVGDEVCALLNEGGYAERVVAEAGQVLPVPRGVTLVEAGGLVETAATVLSNLDIGLAREGSRVLVHGGAGGIGTMAIQMATAMGMHVMATAGTDEKVRTCLALGAEQAVNYRDEDFVERVRDWTSGEGVDMVLDNMAAEYLERNIQSLSMDGHLVIIGFQGGVEARIDLWRLWQRRGALHTTALRTRPIEQKAEIIASVRERVWPLVEAGSVRPITDRTMPLREAEAAHRLMESSAHVGKILLVPEG